MWNNPIEEKFFYEGYGKTEIDRSILAYYRHERIVEDIAIYAEELLSTTTTGSNKSEMYKHFTDMFEPQGVVDIAFKTDDASMAFNDQNPENIQIVTVGSSSGSILRTKTEDITNEELPLAQSIIRKLFSAIKPHLPAAGLAAPQIGISKSVFIFSFDRDPNHLEGVINPSYTPVGEVKVEGWEGCFSAMLGEGTSRLAKVPRYETIHVQYLNENGERVEKVLEGFAAKVFQHEYDHLQGTVNIDREDAVVRDFPNQEEMLKFMQEVKKEDSLQYKNPN